MLSKARIKTRVYAGFLATLVLLAVVAGAALWVFVSVSGRFVAVAEATSAAVLVVQTDRQVAAFDRRVSDYLRRPSAQALSAVRGEERRLNDILGRLTAQVRSGPAVGHVTAIDQAFAAYRQLLGPALELAARRQEIITGTLDPTASRLVGEVREIKEAAATAGDADTASTAGRLIQHMLQAQRAVDDYLLSRSEESFALAWEELFKVDEAIAALPTAGGAHDLYAQYDEGLNALSATIGEIWAAEEQLAGQGITITRETEQAKDRILAVEAEIQAAATSELEGAGTLIGALTVVSLLLGTAAAILIGRGIVNPVAAMTEAMRRLAAGDKTVPIPATDRSDEIGEMAAAVQVFKDNAIEVERLEGERAAAEAEARKARRAAMLRLADQLESSVSGAVQAISGAAHAMQSAAEQMSATAEDTTRQATTVADTTREANANVEVVASAAEELSASIHEIATQVNQSAGVAGEAVTEAGRANQQVEGLLAATARIGEVVGLITNVAEQTNLLALNATIEAARAGEAGKGFAVVAGEVKNLANQTARATEDIVRQIGAVQEATQDAVQAIGKVARVIDRMSEISAAISAAVEEQGAATQEIARNTTEAAHGTHAVTNTIGAVTQAAQETGAAAHHVLDSANDLQTEADRLTTAVNDFLTHIRQGDDDAA